MDKIGFDNPAGGSSEPYVHTLELSARELKSKEIEIAKKARLNKFYTDLHQTRKNAYNLDMNFLDSSKDNIKYKRSKVHNHLKKATCCATSEAFRSLPTNEHFKTGANFCKSKICATCNAILSKKRQNLLTNYLIANYENHYFYMITFTKKASGKRDFLPVLNLVKNRRAFMKRCAVKNGNGLELSEKGTPRKDKEYFNLFDFGYVGGFSNIELKISSKNDKSLHEHIHMIIVSKKRIDFNDFTPKIKRAWYKITGDSHVVNVKSIFAKIDNKFIDWSPNLPIEQKEKVFRKSISEAIKYPLKPSQANLQKLGIGFLNQFLGCKSRLYARHGELYGVKSLCMDYKDLDKLSEQDTTLFSPSTGETFDKENTEISITKQDNAKSKFYIEYPKPTLLEPKPEPIVTIYFEFQDLSKVKTFDNMQDAQIYLSRIELLFSEGNIIKSDTPAPNQNIESVAPISDGRIKIDMNIAEASFENEITL
jgi:hypothetical protein